MTLEEFKDKVFAERPEVKAAYEELEPECKKFLDTQKKTRELS